MQSVSCAQVCTDVTTHITHYTLHALSLSSSLQLAQPPPLQRPISSSSAILLSTPPPLQLLILYRTLCVSHAFLHLKAKPWSRVFVIHCSPFQWGTCSSSMIVRSQAPIHRQGATSCCCLLLVARVRVRVRVHVCVRARTRVCVCVCTRVCVCSFFGGPNVALPAAMRSAKHLQCASPLPHVILAARPALHCA